MRTDGLFRTKLVRLKAWPTGKPLTLIPFGDIHHDSPAHAADAFGKFCDHARRQKDALFLGMGDYLDSFSTSERAIIYDRRLHDSTCKGQERGCRRRIGALADQLEFMRGKLIGLLGGNHYPEFQDGTTGDMVLAERLGTSYLGACAAIRIAFGRADSGHTCACDIFAHHGKGLGTTAGGRFNSVEKLLGVCDCDIALMGDNHARGCFPAGDRLHLHSASTNGGLVIKSKARWIGRTGSFLRGYVDNESSYVVDGAMPPSNLGWIEFVLTPLRDRSDGIDILSVHIGARQ